MTRILVRAAAVVVAVAGLCPSGCEMPRTHSFETTLELRDPDGGAVERAYLVRVLKITDARGPDRFGSAAPKHWNREVEILPVGDGSRVSQPAVRTVRYVRLADKESVDAYYEYLLLAEGCAGRLVGERQLEAGRITLTSLTALEDGREAWRSAEFIDREVLPALEPGRPFAREVLEIAHAQLLWLRERRMINLGLDSRLRRVERALAEAAEDRVAADAE